MKINVKVKLHSSRAKVEPISATDFVVFLTKAPEKGKANEQLIELISDHFNIPKFRVKIVSGKKSKNKIIEMGKG